MQHEQLILSGNQLRNSIIMNIQNFEEDYPQEMQAIQQWDQLFRQGVSGSSDKVLIEAGENLCSTLQPWSITFDDGIERAALIHHWVEAIASTDIMAA